MVVESSIDNLYIIFDLDILINTWPHNTWPYRSHSRNCWCHKALKIWGSVLISQIAFQCKKIGWKLNLYMERKLLKLKKRNYHPQWCHHVTNNTSIWCNHWQNYPSIFSLQLEYSKTTHCMCYSANSLYIYIGCQY